MCETKMEPKKLTFNGLNANFVSKLNDIDWNSPGLYNLDAWKENNYQMPDTQSWPKPGCPNCGHGKED